MNGTGPVGLAAVGHLYDFPIDTSRTDQAPTIVYQLVGTGKRVLDVGGATGNLGRLLTEAGNEVTVADYNPEAVAKAAVGNARAFQLDVERTTLAEALPGEQFDVVVMADVLEHLRDPLPVLAGVPSVLRPDGVAILSIPNVAHADVRLALLEGRWEYADSGLLDRTHLRWFTLASLLQLIADAGFHVVRMERVRRPVFRTALGVGAHSARLVELLAADPEAETYQFVVVIRPGDAPLDAPQFEIVPHVHTAVIDSEIAALAAERDAALAARDSAAAALHAATTDADNLRTALHNAALHRRVRRIPRRIVHELRRLRRS